MPRKRTDRILPALALALAFAIASGGFTRGALSAQELVLGRSTTPEDLPLALPPVRGLDFDEPRESFEDKGAVSPEDASFEGISLIAEALSWLGTPYRLGGFTKRGVDCSGFLTNVLLASVPELGPFPRSSDGYIYVGSKPDDIEPGDILLFARDKSIYHVGIALSETTFIHSASEGARTGVIISSLYDGSWRRRLYAVRRLKF